MNSTQVSNNIERARQGAGISQRTLSDRTNISQATLSRIISGDRPAKMPEVVRIAEATGHTVAQLTGTTDLTQRVEYAARATNGAGMDAMREALFHFMELDNYLEDQAIPTHY